MSNGQWLSYILDWLYFLRHGINVSYFPFCIIWLFAFLKDQEYSNLLVHKNDWNSIV